MSEAVEKGERPSGGSGGRKSYKQRNVYFKKQQDQTESTDQRAESLNNSQPVATDAQSPAAASNPDPSNNTASEQQQNSVNPPSRSKSRKNKRNKQRAHKTDDTEALQEDMSMLSVNDSVQPVPQQVQYGNIVAVTTHVFDWTEHDVAQWVASVGFPQYSMVFLENNLDGRCLQDLAFDDLKNELGIASFGHRLKLWHNINSLLTFFFGGGKESHTPTNVPEAQGMENAYNDAEAQEVEMQEDEEEHQAGQYDANAAPRNNRRNKRRNKKFNKVRQ